MPYVSVLFCRAKLLLDKNAKTRGDCHRFCMLEPSSPSSRANAATKAGSITSRTSIMNCAEKREKKETGEKARRHVSRRRQAFPCLDLHSHT
jgi:hypothetical protein